MFLGICRVIHGKCVRTVFTHELVSIRNSRKERAQRESEISDTNQRLRKYHTDTIFILYCVYYMHTGIQAAFIGFSWSIQNVCR